MYGYECYLENIEYYFKYNTHFDIKSYKSFHYNHNKRGKGLPPTH